MLIRDPKKRMKAHEVLCFKISEPTLLDVTSCDVYIDQVIAESLSEEEIAGLKEMF
ncbi:hypothetical protein YC2023_047417 [Brassica napus]